MVSNFPLKLAWPPVSIKNFSADKYPSAPIVKSPFAAKAEAETLVPENREERTTEGGLRVKEIQEKLKNFISPLRSLGIRVSFFIEQDIEQINATNKVGADIVELHTGHFCELFEREKKKNYMDCLEKIEKASKHADFLDLEVHAGHGLTVDSVALVSQIAEIKELNIGHSIISDSIS